jgi:hypothetical protein
MGKSQIAQSEIPPSKNSPSKTRRHKGLGSGSIQWKTITLHGKDYPQAWYHYEFWKNGDRLVKKCKYIPKRLLGRIEKLEAEDMLSLHSVLAMVYGMCTSEGSLAYCSVLGFRLNAEIQREVLLVECASDRLA